MTEAIKFGALCWNQYTDWPSLLEAGIRADRLGYRHALDVGPPVPDRRRLARPDLRGLAGPDGLGPGDQRDPDRPDGRREHVPRADPRRQDGHDARPHQQRPGDPRDRRGLVRGGARGLRAAVRRRPAGAPALARRGAAGHPRHARRDRAVGGRPALRRPRVRNLPGADPAPPADPRRRRRRAGHPQARRAVRRCEQRRRRDRERPAQGGDPARALRGGRARRAEIERTTGIGTVFIRDDRAEAERLFRAAFERNRRRQPLGGPAGRDARRTSRSDSRRTSSSATGTSSPGCRRPTTRSR